MQRQQRRMNTTEGNASLLSKSDHQDDMYSVYHMARWMYYHLMQVSCRFFLFFRQIWICTTQLRQTRLHLTIIIILLQYRFRSRSVRFIHQPTPPKYWTLFSLLYCKPPQYRIPWPLKFVPYIPIHLKLLCHRQKRAVYYILELYLIVSAAKSTWKLEVVILLLLRGSKWRKVSLLCCSCEKGNFCQFACLTATAISRERTKVASTTSDDGS